MAKCGFPWLSHRTMAEVARMERLQKMIDRDERLTDRESEVYVLLSHRADDNNAPRSPQSQDKA